MSIGFMTIIPVGKDQFVPLRVGIVRRIEIGKPTTIHAANKKGKKIAVEKGLPYRQFSSAKEGKSTNVPSRVETMRSGLKEIIDHFTR